MATRKRIHLARLLMPSQRSFRKVSLLLILPLFFSSAVPAFALKQTQTSEAGLEEELKQRFQQPAAGLPLPDRQDVSRDYLTGYPNEGGILQSEPVIPPPLDSSEVYGTNQPNLDYAELEEQVTTASTVRFLDFKGQLTDSREGMTAYEKVSDGQNIQNAIRAYIQASAVPVNITSVQHRDGLNEQFFREPLVYAPYRFTPGRDPQETPYEKNWGGMTWHLRRFSSRLNTLSRVGEHAGDTSPELNRFRLIETAPGQLRVDPVLDAVLLPLMEQLFELVTQRGYSDALAVFEPSTGTSPVRNALEMGLYGLLTRFVETVEKRHGDQTLLPFPRTFTDLKNMLGAMRPEADASLSRLQEFLARPEVTGGKGIRARVLTGLGRQSYDALVVDQIPSGLISELAGGLSPLLSRLNSQGPFTWGDVAGGLGAAQMQAKLMFPDLSTILADVIRWTKKDFDPVILAELEKQAADAGVDLWSRSPNFLQANAQSVDLRTAAKSPLRLITMMNALAYNEDPLRILANLYNQLKPDGILVTNLYIPVNDARAGDLVKFYEKLQEHLNLQGVAADFRILNWSAPGTGERNSLGESGPFFEHSIGIVLGKQRGQRLEVLRQPESTPVLVENKTVRDVTYQVAWYGEDPTQAIRVVPAAGLEEVSARISGTRQVTVSAGQKTATFSFDAGVLEPLLFSPDRQILVVRTTNKNLYAHDLSKLAAEGTAPRIWNHSVSKGDAVRFSDDGRQVLLEHLPATKRRLPTTLALDARTGDPVVSPPAVKPNGKITPQQVHVMVLAESASNRRDALDVIRGELSPQGVDRDQSVGLTGLAMLQRHLSVLKERNVTPTLVLVGNNNNFVEEARTMVYRKFNPSIPVFAFNEGGPEKLKQPIEKHVLSRLIPSGQPAAGLEEDPRSRLMTMDEILALVAREKEAAGTTHGKMYLFVYGEPRDDLNGLKQEIERYAGTGSGVQAAVYVGHEPNLTRIFIGRHRNYLSESSLSPRFDESKKQLVYFKDSSEAVAFLAGHAKVVRLGNQTIDLLDIDPQVKGDTLRYAAEKVTPVVPDAPYPVAVVFGGTVWLGYSNDPRLQDPIGTRMSAAAAAERIEQRGIVDWTTGGQKISALYGAQPDPGWTPRQWIQRIVVQPFGDTEVKLAFGPDGDVLVLAPSDADPKGSVVVSVKMTVAPNYIRKPPDGATTPARILNGNGTVIAEEIPSGKNAGDAIERAIYQAIEQWPVTVTIQGTAVYIGRNPSGQQVIHRAVALDGAFTQIKEANVRWVHIDHFGTVNWNGSNPPRAKFFMERLVENKQVGLTILGNEAWVSRPAAGLEERPADIQPGEYDTVDRRFPLESVEGAQEAVDQLIRLAVASRADETTPRVPLSLRMLSVNGSAAPDLNGAEATLFQKLQELAGQNSTAVDSDRTRLLGRLVGYVRDRTAAGLEEKGTNLVIPGAGPVVSVAYNHEPASRTLVAANADGGIFYLNRESGQRESGQKIRHNTGDALVARFSAAGSAILVVGTRSAATYNAPHGALVVGRQLALNPPLKISPEEFYSGRIALSPGRTSMLVVEEGASSAVIRNLDPERVESGSGAPRQVMAELTPDHGVPTSVAYRWITPTPRANRDGHLAAVGTSAGTIELWDTRNVARGEPNRFMALTGHPKAVISLAFDEKGNRTARKLASGDTVGQVRILDVYKPETPRVVQHHSQERVQALAFSPSEDLLASTGQSGTIYFWNSQTGELRGTIEGGTPIFSMEFSPDGKKITAGFKTSRGKIWTVPAAGLEENQQLTDTWLDGIMDKVGNGQIRHVKQGTVNLSLPDLTRDRLAQEVRVIADRNGGWFKPVRVGNVLQILPPDVQEDLPKLKPLSFVSMTSAAAKRNILENAQIGRVVAVVYRVGDAEQRLDANQVRDPTLVQAAIKAVTVENGLLLARDVHKVVHLAPPAPQSGVEEAARNVSFAEVLSAVRAAVTVRPLSVDRIRIIGNKPGEGIEPVIQPYGQSPETVVQAIADGLRELFGSGVKNALYSVRIEGREMVITQPVHVVLSNGRTKLAAGVNDFTGPIGELDADQPPPVSVAWDSVKEIDLAGRSPLERSVSVFGDMVEQALKFHGISADRLEQVGVATTGFGDFPQGVIMMQNLPDHGLAVMQDLRTPLEQELQRRFGRPIPIVFFNDGVAGVLGEHNLPDGALHDVQDGIFVIVGGGVGSGEMEGGKPVYAIPGVIDAFLNEIGWHIVTIDGGTTWVWRGEGAAQDNLVPNPASGENEWALEQHMAGPFLAARAVKWMRDRGRGDVFGEGIGIQMDSKQKLSKTDRPVVSSVEQQTLVLKKITELGRQGDADALDFIRDSGRAMGAALGAFRQRFQDRAFAWGRVAIGSSVGEKFGMGIDGDPFLTEVKKAIGTEDVVRALKTGVEREWAFSMPVKTTAAVPEETLSAFMATTVSAEIRTQTGLIFMNLQGLAVGATLKYASNPSGKPLFRRYVAENDLQVQVLNELGIPNSEIVSNLEQAKLDIRNQNLNPRLIGDVRGAPVSLLQEIQKVVDLLTPENYDQQQAEKAAQEVLRLFL